MPDVELVEERFAAALERFLEKARQDPYVLAVVLFGSMSYDVVWEKSDIDLIVVTRDETGLAARERRENLALVENDVNLSVILMPRSEFRKAMEGSLRSSFMHSLLVRSKLVYTRDETIAELYEGIAHMGAHDRQVQLLRAGTSVVPGLYKAEKWLRVRGDVDYAFMSLLYCAMGLAQVEVALASRISGREVLQQALELNPEFFRAIYTDLVRGPKTAAAIGSAIEAVDGYLTGHMRTLFGPVLDYLAEAGAPRSATEIETHFRNEMDLSGVSFACEWLADKDVVVKVSSPVYLTKKSRVAFEEMAFYYDPMTMGVAPGR